jgi:hypothetical protein
MTPFKLTELKVINELPKDDSQSWLIDAEGSVDFLRRNSKSDDIVIYASGSSVLIHGVLALTINVSPPDGKDLQDANIPMPDNSRRIQKVWGGCEGHRMYLEPPLSSSSKSFQGGEKLIFRRRFDGVEEGPTTIELSQKLVHTSGEGSYCNGAFIVRPSVSVGDLVQSWKDEESDTTRSYAKFKIYDRKNDVNVETSCGPEFISNYFQETELPWEISPAFFRSEVLHRFKADPEKYSLDERSIGPRQADLAHHCPGDHRGTA